MSGCARKTPSEIIFKGWPYEPELVRENIESFIVQSKINVGYEAVSGNYHDKMVALFVGEMRLTAATCGTMILPSGLRPAGCVHTMTCRELNSTQTTSSTTTWRQ